MKYSTILAGSLASTAAALSIFRPDQAPLSGVSAFDQKPLTSISPPQRLDTDQEQFLIELNPGELRWITEDEKWVLRRVRYAHQSLF